MFRVTIYQIDVWENDFSINIIIMDIRVHLPPIMPIGFVCHQRVLSPLEGKPAKNKQSNGLTTHTHVS